MPPKLSEENVTSNLKFLLDENIRIFPPKEFSGIVVFVIHPPTVEKLVKALSSFLSEVKEFKGKLFVVEEEGFEIID